MNWIMDVPTSGATDTSLAREARLRAPRSWVHILVPERVKGQEVQKASVQCDATS